MDTQTAGTVRASGVADHWRVSLETARRLLNEAGVTPVNGSGWNRYSWRDIWRMEGVRYVPSHDYAAYKAPLLRTHDVVRLDPAGRSERTIRRLMAQGDIPVIFLSRTLRRMREVEVERAMENV